MRRTLGVILLVLGVPVLLVGAVAAVFVGPDDTVDLVDQDFSTEGSALVTSPGLLSVTGPTLHVRADGGDVETFVGVANPVHVAAYLDGVAHEGITQAALDGLEVSLTSGSVDGDAAPEVAPAGLDWWDDQAVGTGQRSVSVELDADPANVVVMRADASAPLAVRLVVAGEIDGLFLATSGVAVIGLALIVASLGLLRAARRRRRATSDVVAPDGADGTRDDDMPASESATEAGTQRPARRIAVIGVSAAGATMFAGCGLIPQQVDRAGDTPTVISATDEQAEDFFTTYTETNNAANAAQDAGLLATIEGGTLLETSSFGYEVQKAQRAEPHEPFTVSPTSIASPELTQYPLWYMASSEFSNSEAPSWHLVVRESPTEPWLAHLSIDLPDGAEVPEPVVTGGHATLPGEEVTASSQDVLDSLVDYARTGTAPDGVDVAQAGELANLHRHGLQADNLGEYGTATNTCRLDDADAVHWLATDAGALALASLRCTQTMELVAGAVFTSSEPFSTIPTGTDLRRASITQAVAFAIEVREDGTTSLFGGGMDLVSTSFTTA